MRRLLLAVWAAHGALADAHPDERAARARGPQIFNTVHNAMRQWGSSVHHNGMSVFPVVAPRGSLFYHGTQRAARPQGFEWLAFEVEHARGFGRSREEDPVYGDPDAAQHVFGGPQPTPRPSRGRGYVHTYRATRPLRLLYFDGMAAGKGRIGMVDSQDLLILDGFDDDDGDDWSDWERARHICELGANWGALGIDGILRMEAGFEIVYCNFQDGGLELASLVGSPFRNETTGESNPREPLGLFEQVRAVAQRYDGFESGRVAVDWSGMVSAFGYAAVNVSNADPSRPELPRLTSAAPAALRSVARRVADVFSEDRDPAQAVDWQAVTDAVVSRFAPRLEALLRPATPATQMRVMVDSLVNPFISFPVVSEDASRVQACAGRHLDQPRLGSDTWTPEDRVIFAALDAVLQRICRDLFEIRAELDPPRDDHHRDAARARVVRLWEWLDWARRRRCAEGCELHGKICFIAMFPLGAAEDHFTPQCKNATEIAQSHGYFWDG